MKTVEQLLSLFPCDLKDWEKDLIVKAYQFSQQAHERHKRYSGEPYFVHPVAAAEILISLGQGPEVVVAGLLHDTIEDADVAPDVLEKEFGRGVRRLVEGVSNVSALRLRRSQGGSGAEAEFIDNLRHFFLVVARDARVELVKLADRLHNMRTLKYVPEHKQARIARETMEVYAPLADRLGMGQLKGELEDLSFFYLEPEKFAWLELEVNKHFRGFKRKLPEIKRQISRVLKQSSVEYTLQARAKHWYSLYCKLAVCGNDFNRIHDIVALRVIVGSVEDCYTVLGIIHAHWKPLLGTIKDYISQPKTNGYQSLHTTVFGPLGQIVEIQIRTKEMHEKAENGLASHWYYSQAKVSGLVSKTQLEKGLTAPKEKISWVNILLGWQKQAEENQEFFDGLKNDLLNKRIFVFTPEGDVVDLPIGATPVDFAYALHSQLGDLCSEAKIDGKMSPLSSKLQNGQIVEIIKGKRKQPSQGWLDFVITVEAKRKIRASVKRAKV